MTGSSSEDIGVWTSIFKPTLYDIEWDPWSKNVHLRRCNLRSIWLLYVNRLKRLWKRVYDYILICLWINRYKKTTRICEISPRKCVLFNCGYDLIREKWNTNASNEANFDRIFYWRCSKASWKVAYLQVFLGSHLIFTQLKWNSTGGTLWERRIFVFSPQSPSISEAPPVIFQLL